MRSDRERLLDILEAIDKILSRSSGDQAVFEEDELLQVWAVHHLQIIGEAAARLSSEVRAAHLEVEWSKLIGMRHVLVHGYFEVDADIVWATVIRDLPPLRRDVVTILVSDADLS